MSISIYDFRLPIADWGRKNALTKCREVPVINRQPRRSRAGHRYCGATKWQSTIGNHQSSIGSRRGLTLIEVMLAIVILGIGTGVLLLSTAKCLSIVTKSQRYSAAQRLLQQVGAEHPLTRGNVEAGIDSGGFYDEEDYHWEREITESENENLKGLFTVRTRVIWSDRGRNSFEETFTWLYIKPEEEL